MKSIAGKTVLSIVVLLVAAGVSFLLYSNKPKTKKAKPERPVPVVKTIEVRPSTEPVVFEASGTVIPARKVELQTEVEGRVIDLNPELVPGGIIGKDELVIQIDPTDYRLQVSERQADVATARYELEVEEGRQIIARQEWKVLEKELHGDKASRNLALREPHLKNARARLEAAQSRLEAAKLAEKRTTIRAPFTGLVLTESVEKGQFVGRQTPIATLVATDRFWVQASVPLSLLDRLHFPGNSGEDGSPARIILEKGYGGKPSIREGTLFKLLADLDPKGRMARILVTVRDPFNLQEIDENETNPGSDQGKILLDSYVKVRINAGELENVYTIPREALREGDRLWLVNAKGILDIRDVRVLWRRVDEVLVDARLADDERLVVSRLQSPVPGMTVRDSRFPTEKPPDNKKIGK